MRFYWIGVSSDSLEYSKVCLYGKKLILEKKQSEAVDSC